MTERIAAVLLAAGASQRMGQPKLLLPWGGTSVLGQVIVTFADGLFTQQVYGWEIVVVTGGAHKQVEELVASLSPDLPVRSVYNPQHAQGGMLSSLQAGLKALGPDIRAALVGLGDQPQVKAETIRAILAAYIRKRAGLVIPTYQDRRGHPWLVERRLWKDLLGLPAGATARDFLNGHSQEGTYIPADESILEDLDTPEDYANFRPE